MLHLAHTLPGIHPNHLDREARAIQSAWRLYQRVCMQGWLRNLWATLMRQPRRLMNLAEIETTCRIDNRYSTGVQTVPIEQIRGSYGRCHDFDSSFYPRRSHTKGRWLQVAQARQRGISLPPVELTQVGEIYFVRDGHHRISVARALGQTDIEAEVRIWRIACPVS